eukprot:2801727-Amphidinium_carterae.1
MRLIDVVIPGPLHSLRVYDGLKRDDQDGDVNDGRDDAFLPRLRPSQPSIVLLHGALNGRQ